MCEQLAQGCYKGCPELNLNPRPTDRKSNAIPIAPLHHPVFVQAYLYASSYPFACGISKYPQKQTTIVGVGICTRQVHESTVQFEG